MIDVLLPLAPPINSTNAGRKHTMEMVEWKAHAGWLLKIAKLERVSGKYYFHMELPEHDRADIDARIKHMMDLFVTMRLTDDDKHCRRLLVEYLPVLDGVCRVAIEAMP